jgi:hypothetical protein
VRSTLADDGIWMIVEPFANDRVEDNLNPVGRIYYSASTMICTPCSLAQDVGLGLGAQAGEKRLRGVAEEGGFSRLPARRRDPVQSCLRSPRLRYLLEKRQRLERARMRHEVRRAAHGRRLG